MFSDSEASQLHHLHLIYQTTTPLLLNGNSFEKKICKCVNKFNELNIFVEWDGYIVSCHIN